MDVRGVACWLTILGALTLASTAAAQERRWIIPPGREDVARALVEPIVARGFAGYETGDISIDRDRVVVGLLDPSEAVSTGPCAAAPDRPRPRPSWLEVSRAAPLDPVARGSSGRRAGAVARRGLVLSWTLCGEALADSLDAASLRAEAERLLDALPSEAAGRLWSAPLPRHASHRPPVLPWVLLGLGLALAVALARPAWRSLGALALVCAALLWLTSAWWHHAPIALLWATLPVACLLGLTALRHDPRGEALPFAAIFAVALTVACMTPSTTGNWYVDYHEPATSASVAFVKNPGGPAWWPSLIDTWIALDLDALFAVKRVAFAFAAAFLGVAMRRTCLEDGSPWPRNTWWVWIALVLFDETSRWLAASDAPHGYALLAWALLFFALSEAPRAGPDRPRTSATISMVAALCAALVGLTRVEQSLMPLALLPIVLTHDLRHRGAARGRALVATLLGTGVALGAAAIHGAGRHVASSWTAATGGAGLSSRFLAFVDLPPLLEAPVSIGALGLFVALATRRPRLLAVPAGVVLFELLKVAGGFGMGGIGGTDPRQRYHVIVIPLLLLMIAAGAAAVGEEAWRAARARWSPSPRWTAVVALTAFAFLGAAATLSRRPPPPMAFQVEHDFLLNATRGLPRGALITTTWLNGMSQDLSHLEGPLAIPHANLTWQRRDLRWRLIHPGEPLPEELGFIYLGMSCLARPPRDHRSTRRNELIVQTLEICRALERRMRRTLAEQTIRGARAMNPGVFSETLTLRLGTEDEMPPFSPSQSEQ